MYFLNKSGVKSLTIYLLCFAALWYAVLLSGVHATVAGVLAAMMIPIRKTPGAPDAVDSPLHMLEHAIAPRSEEHTSELQSLMRISYAVFCLKKKNHKYTELIKNKTNITRRYNDD